MNLQSWDNPFSLEDELALDTKAVGLEDELALDNRATESVPVFEEQAIDTSASYLEPQAHGGALLRYPQAEPNIITFPTPQSVAPWPAGLTFDLSIGIDDTQTILDRYELDPEDYERLMAIPAFRRELAESMRRNQAEGLSFSRKTAAIAEECIPDMYNLIKDPMVPASTRADVWKHMAKVGNLEPKSKETSATGSAPVVQIQINL